MRFVGVGGEGERAGVGVLGAVGTRPWMRIAPWKGLSKDGREMHAE